MEVYRRRGTGSLVTSMSDLEAGGGGGKVQTVSRTMDHVRGFHVLRDIEEVVTD